jgi:type 1 glutamine amidotransferase
MKIPRIVGILGVVFFAALVLSHSRAAAQPDGSAAEKPATPSSPLRIFLRGGAKTHGPADNGVHDHPGWVREWTPLLEARGAKVVGSLEFPTAEQLEQSDVVVMFHQNAGSILGEQRANLEAFLKRGGGIVVIHDALVADRSADWFSEIVGGAWNGRTARYFEGENTYYYVNQAHPITKGAANFKIDDEVYWQLIMRPRANILAAAMEPPRRGRRGQPAPPQPAINNLIPQIWVYENQLEAGQPYRAYVNLLGHHFRTFSSPHVRAVMLRGIAWAGKRDVDLLTTPEEVAGLSLQPAAAGE